jgi:uncharacterized phage protein (TIGR01671 family)
MREIKFKAWDKIQKKILSVTQIVFTEWGKRAGVQVNDDGFRWIDWDDAVLMQFTGLLDKNGKEIYEGDIVRVQSQYETDEPVDSAPNTVYFKDGAFRCGFYNMILGENVCTGKAGNWNMEVIGNIYENLELVEAK